MAPKLLNRWWLTWLKRGLTLAATLVFAGCTHEPSGVYVSQADKEDQICLDFRPQGKVIIRDLSAPLSDPFVVESEYTQTRDIIVIKAFNVFGINGALELSINGSTLVAANGVKFVKDKSGRKYTPLERAKEVAKAEAEAMEVRIRQKAAWEEARRVAAEKELAQMHEAAKERDERSRELAAASMAKAEDEAAKSRALQKANAAKIAAIASLPTFTNQIVTIVTSEGVGYTNISLIRASLDGIIYLVPESTIGGCIYYTNLALDDFARFNIDTNCIAIAEERAIVRSKAEAYESSIMAQQGTAAAAAFRADWERWWKQQQRNSPYAYAPSMAFQARYGLTPYRAVGSNRLRTR